MKLSHQQITTIINTILLVIWTGILVYFFFVWDKMMTNTSKYIESWYEIYNTKVKQWKNLQDLYQSILLSDNVLTTQFNHVLEANIWHTWSLLTKTTNQVSLTWSWIWTWNTITINTIWLQTKLRSINISDIKTEDELYSFIEEELKKWVVLFPWVKPDSKDNWVISIYWHSSQLDGHIDYSYFLKLSYVQNNDIIDLQYNGVDHQYQVISSTEQNINDVDSLKKEYREKNDWQYIFLITCWPINTTHKRWLVIAKLIH